MKCAGLDFSINCSAVAILKNEIQSFETLSPKDCIFFFFQANQSEKRKKKILEFDHVHIFPEFQTKNYTNDIQRFTIIANWILDKLQKFNIEKLYLEGYSLGSKGLVFNIAEATGIMKFLVQNSGIEIEIVPPTVHKKLFCGKGNGNKELMIKSFKDKYPDFIELNNYDEIGISPISDIVDSFAVLNYGFKKEKEEL